MQSKFSIVFILIIILIFSFIGGYYFYNKTSFLKDENANSNKNIKNFNVNENQGKKDSALQLEERLTRFDQQGNITALAVLLNPIQEGDKFILIKTQFNTHTENLDLYNFRKLLHLRLAMN
ncbi:hypothetical protein [Caloramator australicus]|uniref:Uncharacterized protein n=1 Tax=Caloramator australicus RC3 TaxID=857293 RepID=I7KWF8_9CLOT|nr:hypothetical protein [Caloramator australicus]CCJ34491.1 hypothetical protein CAAU_2408 [Caloramator australicus RC3]